MIVFNTVVIIVSLMNKTRSFPTQVRKLLQTHTVMTLKQISHELNGRSRSSLFRDLKKVDVITSYTHGGQYHAVKSAARFDVVGLWFFKEIGFSKYGTLKNTLEQIIRNAEVGMTHKELEQLLHIKVHNTLNNLVKFDVVKRHFLPNNIYVYLSADEHKAQEQLQRKLTINKRVSDITLPPECVRIEILVELIRSSGNSFDEKQLGTILRQKGLAIKDEEIAYVFKYYAIKKKQILKS